MYNAGGSWGNAGITLNNVNNGNITSCNLNNNNFFGILLIGSYNNTLYGNNASYKLRITLKFIKPFPDCYHTYIFQTKNILITKKLKKS